MRSLVVLVAFVAAPAFAQIGLTPRVAYDFRYDSPATGLAVELGIARGSLPFAPSVRPSVEYVFHDRQDRFAQAVAGYDLQVVRGDLDFLGRFTAPGAPFAPYAKAGVAVRVTSGEVPTPSSRSSSFNADVIPTLGGGAAFGRMGLEVSVDIGARRPARLVAGYRF